MKLKSIKSKIITAIESFFDDMYVADTNHTDWTR